MAKNIKICLFILHALPAWFFVIIKRIFLHFILEISTCIYYNIYIIKERRNRVRKRKRKKKASKLDNSIKVVALLTGLATLINQVIDLVQKLIK